MNIEEIKKYVIEKNNDLDGNCFPGDEFDNDDALDLFYMLTTLLQAYEKQEKKIDQLTQEGNARAWDDRSEDLQSRIATLTEELERVMDKIPLCSICHKPACDNPKHQPLISNEDWERIKNNMIESQEIEIATLTKELEAEKAKCAGLGMELMGFKGGKQ